MRGRVSGAIGASIALGAGLLAFGPAATAAPISTASVTWSTPVDVAAVNPAATDLQLVTTNYFSGASQQQVAMAAWLAGGQVTVVESTDNAATFTNPVAFSTTCNSSLTSLSIAIFEEKFAAAYECDGDVVISQADVGDLLNRTDLTVSPTSSTANKNVGLGYAGGRPLLGQNFTPVVSWVDDGASDDTAYLAASTVGLDNTWNRDDSPIVLATGTEIAAGTTFAAAGFQGANTSFALNVDDTVVVTSVRRTFNSFNVEDTAVVGGNVNGVPTVASTADAERIFTSWTNGDDTVQSSISTSTTSFPNPPYDVTTTSGDRGQPSVAIGWSGGAASILRRVVVFDDTVGGIREVRAAVSDDSTTFDDTTLSVTGETVLTSPEVAPNVAGNTSGDDYASFFWVASSGGSQRVKSALGEGLIPPSNVARPFEWGPTTSVSADFTSIDAVAGHGNALGWFANDGSTVTLQVTVFSSAPSPGPGPGPGPAPGPTPDPATPAGPVQNLTVEPGDSSVVASWEAPANSGDFPITNYQVTTQPSSNALCLVPATSTSCVLAPLTNGVEYTIKVRALSGAGWGAWATSEAVTPTPGTTKSILVEGSRTDNGRTVRVTGLTTGLVGATVQAEVKVGDASEFSAGSTRVVGESGSFTWKRRGPAEVSVYFTAEGATSNTLTIPPR